MDKRDELIKKLEELVTVLKLQLDIITDNKNIDVPKYIRLFNLNRKFESEIAALEKQIEKEAKVNINTPFFGNSGARPDVSDADIEAWADEKTLGLKGDPYIRKLYKGLIDGAKSMRDGLIKKIEK